MADLDFPNAVTDEGSFYGRQDLLREILHTIQRRQRVPILVVGERRIGKTSLQNIAVQQLLQADSSFHVLDIQPRGINNFADFIQSILRQLAAWMREYPGVELRIPQNLDSVEELEYLLSRLAELSQKA